MPDYKIVVYTFDVNNYINPIKYIETKVKILLNEGYVCKGDIVVASVRNPTTF